MQELEPFEQGARDFVHAVETAAKRSNRIKDAKTLEAFVQPFAPLLSHQDFCVKAGVLQSERYAYFDVRVDRTLREHRHQTEYSAAEDTYWENQLTDAQAGYHALKQLATLGIATGVLSKPYLQEMFNGLFFETEERVPEAREAEQRALLEELAELRQPSTIEPGYELRASVRRYAELRESILDPNELLLASSAIAAADHLVEFERQMRATEIELDALAEGHTCARKAQLVPSGTEWAIQWDYARSAWADLGHFLTKPVVYAGFGIGGLGLSMSLGAKMAAAVDYLLSTPPVLVNENVPIAIGCLFFATGTYLTYRMTREVTPELIPHVHSVGRHLMGYDVQESEEERDEKTWKKRSEPLVHQRGLRLLLQENHMFNLAQTVQFGLEENDTVFAREVVNQDFLDALADIPTQVQGVPASYSLYRDYDWFEKAENEMAKRTAFGSTARHLLPHRAA